MRIIYFIMYSCMVGASEVAGKEIISISYDCTASLNNLRILNDKVLRT
jgi:hypothetical protein